MKKNLTLFVVAVIATIGLFAQKANESGLVNSKGITISQKTSFTPVWNSPKDTTVLFEQMAATTNGTSSQDFETANDAYDDEAADDFTVTSGPWNINFVSCYGSYSSGGGPLEYVHVTFYNDNSGVPGTVAQQFTNIPCSVNETTGLVSINLPSTVTLNDGTYWLSIVARMDYGSSGQWFWTESSTTNGTHYQWRNPGDGFGEGQTDWGDGQNDYDLTFSLANIVLTSDDIATTVATPTWVMNGNSATPTVTVKNMGTNTQNDFTVGVIIYDGATEVYNSTSSVTGANLATGATTTVTLPDSWNNPALGTYSMKAFVTLTGDVNTANDTLQQDVEVVHFSYSTGKNYSYDAYSSNGLQDHIITNNLDNGELSDLMQATTNNFLSCGEYIDSIVMGVENGTNILYFINGDGKAYPYGTITGAGSITGMAYDEVNSVIYLAALGSTSSILYTLDLATLVATEIGEIGAYTVLGIATDADGSIYRIEVDSDNFLSINKTTGAGTVIGATGLNLKYAQDIGSDRVNNVIYGTLYDSTAAGGFYTFNTSTGTANLILNYQDELTMCAVVNYVTYNAAFTVTDMDNNPLEGANISVDGNSSTTNAQGQATVALASGTYTVITSMTGYINDTISITVADADLVVDTIKLQAAANIKHINNNVSIYPNPTSGIININTNAQIVNIEVTDITGKVIYIGNTNSIDISTQPNGVYFIKVQTEDGIITRKILKK